MHSQLSIVVFRTLQWLIQPLVTAVFQQLFEPWCQPVFVDVQLHY